MLQSQSTSRAWSHYSSDPRGFLGTLLGFGTGHAVQSRYCERGWIFTAGEVSGLTIVGVGAAACASQDHANDNDENDDSVDLDLSGLSCVLGVVGGGGVVYLGFRTWEIIDVWGHPALHNRRYRKLKEQTEGPQVSFHVEPILDGGATLRLGVRF